MFRPVTKQHKLTPESPSQGWRPDVGNQTANKAVPARNRAACFSHRCSWAPGHVSPPATPTLPGVVPVSLGAHGRLPTRGARRPRWGRTARREPPSPMTPAACLVPGRVPRRRTKGRDVHTAALVETIQPAQGPHDKISQLLPFQCNAKKEMDNIPFLKVSITSGHQPLKNCSVTMWSPPSEMETFLVISPLFHPDLRAQDASAVRSQVPGCQTSAGSAGAHPASSPR